MRFAVALNLLFDVYVQVGNSWMRIESWDVAFSMKQARAFGFVGCFVDFSISIAFTGFKRFVDN